MKTLLLLLLLTGCASQNIRISSEGGFVRILHKRPDGCKFLGVYESKSEDAESNLPTAKTLLRNQVGSRGADILYISDWSGYWVGFGTRAYRVTGEAYNCGDIKRDDTKKIDITIRNK